MSSDFLTAGAINQTQYVVFQHMVALHLSNIFNKKVNVGKFSWFVANMQIYDRHIEQGQIMLNRTPIECQPDVWINPEKTDFYTLIPEDIKIVGYPMAEIKERNPQLRFEIGI